MIGQQRYLPDLQAVCMQCVDGGCGCGCGCATLTLSLTVSLTPHSLTLSLPHSPSFARARSFQSPDKGRAIREKRCRLEEVSTS